MYKCPKTQVEVPTPDEVAEIHRRHYEETLKSELGTIITHLERQFNGGNRIKVRRPDPECLSAPVQVLLEAAGWRVEPANVHGTEWFVSRA